MLPPLKYDHFSTTFERVGIQGKSFIRVIRQEGIEMLIEFESHIWNVNSVWKLYFVVLKSLMLLFSIIFFHKRRSSFIMLFLNLFVVFMVWCCFLNNVPFYFLNLYCFTFSGVILSLFMSLFLSVVVLQIFSRFSSLRSFLCFTVVFKITCRFIF